MDIIKFDAGKFLMLSNWIAKLSASIAERGKTNSDRVLSAEGRTVYGDPLNLIKQACDGLGLTFSASYAERIGTQMADESFTYVMLGRRLDELNKRIEDELGAPLFLIVPQDRVKYYDAPELFGRDVFLNFSSLNDDIVCAGNCFATANYTGCVMHLARITEFALRSFAEFLSITMPRKDWNSIADATRLEMARRDTSKAWRLHEKEFCESVQFCLSSARTAWRNRVMHPDKIYSEEQAEDIFNAVKGLMKCLAQNINEKGKFVARRK